MWGRPSKAPWMIWTASWPFLWLRAIQKTVSTFTAMAPCLGSWCVDLAAGCVLVPLQLHIVQCAPCLAHCQHRQHTLSLRVCRTQPTAIRFAYFWEALPCHSRPQSTLFVHLHISELALHCFTDLPRPSCAVSILAHIPLTHSTPSPGFYIRRAAPFQLHACQFHASRIWLRTHF